MVLVKDVMSGSPVCLKLDDLATKARSIIRKHGYRALPVVDDGKLVGIISRGDVLKVMSTRANISVKGLMTKNVVTVRPDENILSAAKNIIKYKVRQLPVVGPQSKPVGIISSMDIINALMEHDYVPSKDKVSEVMSRKIVYCRPEDELSDIWDRMLESGFAGLPVLDDKKVVGMVTRREVLKHGAFRIGTDSGKVKSIMVRKAMRAPAITTVPDAGIQDAAKLMIENRILRLPVVDKSKKIVGIIDAEDILKAYL